MTDKKAALIPIVLLSIALFPQSLRANGKGPSFSSGADLGFGFLDDDGFALFLLEQGFDYKPLHITVSAPLRLRVIDRNPDDPGGLRRQDWDNPSDYTKILRSLKVVYDFNNGFVDFQFGELNGVSMGFGAFVDSYYNSTDMDHYQGGAQLRLNIDGNGVELMVEDVVAPEIIAGRGFVAPISWFSDGPWSHRLELGFTVGADIRAPRRVVTDEEKAVPMAGGDISFKVVDNDTFVLTPYLELGVMDGSPGFHAGMATSWVVSDQKGIRLNARAEYRRLGADYHPAIFNPFYEYNRRIYPYYVAPGMDTPTFADHLADSDDPPNRSGFMVDGTFEWEQGLRIGLRYDREGKNRPHYLMARAEVFRRELFSAGLFYAGQDIEGGDGLFSTDILVGIASRVKIGGPFSVFAEFSRRFRRIGENMFYANESGLGIGIFAAY